MKIKVRPLNDGEVFPCSLFVAKDIFRTTSVQLNFAYGSRDYGTFSNTPDYYLVKKNIKGRVVSSLYMRKKQKDPILSLYVLKKTSWSEEIKNEFEQKVLPAYYQFYYSLAFSEDSEDSMAHLMLTELIDGELKLHQWTYS